jgi:flagellar capping protein FliD
MSTINGFSNNFFQNQTTLNSVASRQSRGSVQNLVSAASPSDNNEILAKSLHYNVEKIPSIEVTSSVGALRVLDAMRYLTSLSYPTQTTITQNIEKKSLNTGVPTDALINIRKSLNSLSAIVAELLDDNSLSNKSARSSDPTLVDVLAGSKSSVGSATVVVKRVSAGNALVSDVQPSTHPALGLTGSFVVNGYTVSVVSSDTIHTLKDKINYGEDLNHNGKLDGTEDIDGTGEAGVIFLHAGEFTPGVYIVKDQNGKGYLNPAEDANSNSRLDGGIKDTKVVATIENDRLKLTSLAGGANTISLQDPNNILLALGFFGLNNKGVPVQKEAQYTISNTALTLPADLMASPHKSVITVDGQTYTSDTNVFEGVVEDATLIANKASGSPVKISISLDPTNAFDRIKTLFNSFNDVIRKINDSLITSKTFEADIDIQRLRNQLTQPQAAIPEVTRLNNNMTPFLTNHENPQMIGFDIKNDRGVLQEIAVNNQVQSIKNKMVTPFKDAPITLQKRLSSLGIQSAEDSTFALDEVGLKRALTINGNEVMGLFTDPQTGIIPQLKNQLDSVLKNDFGRVDLKAVKIEGLTNVPVVLAKKYQKYIDAFTLQEKVQNLITVA